MRERLQNLMFGRNGFDRLSIVMLWTGLGLNLLGRILESNFWNLLSSILLVLAVYRAFSRNIARRQTENQWFMGLGRRSSTRRAARKERHSQRGEYCFFRCPDCRNWLRVPKGKGNLQITCPRCGRRFSGKT